MTVVESTIKDGAHGFMMVNSYFTYNEEIDNHLSNLHKRICDNLRSDTIVSADANAKSTLWCNATTYDSRVKLENYIISQDLNTVNQLRELYTYENTRGYKSNTDITLCTANRDTTIKDWEVQEQSQ